MKKAKTMYMHTLDGAPAYYVLGRQIVYAGWEVRKLASSLRQIRSERKLSEEWRVKSDFLPGAARYGYVRVRVPS